MAEQKDSRHLQARQCPCATLTNPRTFYKESLRFIHCSAKMQLSILLLAAESILAIHTGPLKKKKKPGSDRFRLQRDFFLGNRRMQKGKPLTFFHIIWIPAQRSTSIKENKKPKVITHRIQVGSAQIGCTLFSGTVAISNHLASC